jgi:hypothetical protein
VMIHRALDRFEVDPVGLDRARMRFSQSPPAYVSNPSGTTTRSTSPVLQSELDQSRLQRQTQLETERQASLPYEQFSYERGQERTRLFEAHRKRIQSLPPGEDVDTIARNNVKDHWIERGIWNNKWNDMADGLWKHEEPLELESESETDTEVDSPPRPSLFGMTQQQQQPKPRSLKSDYERRQIAERRVVRERQREASRPYHQFVYQLSNEGERIEDEMSVGLGAGVRAADINTRAYENVKKVWIRRGIWNLGWGILPGMSWKHEEPREEIPADDPVPVSENRYRGLGFTGACATRLFMPNPPVNPSPLQESGAMTVSLPTPPKDICSDISENGHGEHSPYAPASPRTSSGDRARRLASRQSSQTDSTTPSHADREAANTTSGSLHSSNVSKAVGKKTRPEDQTKVSETILSAAADAIEAQPSSEEVTPRRSKRIQSLHPGNHKDSSKGDSRSKPKPGGRRPKPAISSAKPQGISKKKSAKTTKKKLRKA